MITTIELMSGVTLRCFADNRFKQGCLSFAMIRPMCAEEAALNALIPAVLLTLTAEELRELSRSFSEKRKIRRHDLRMKDHTRTTNEQVKGYVARSLHKIRFWMEWSEDAERELRKNLTTTIFIL